MAARAPRLGIAREVAQDRLEIGRVAGAIRALESLVELVEVEAPGGGVVAQGGGDALALGVTGADRARLARGRGGVEAVECLLGYRSINKLREVAS